jgi:hypothetical protein
MHTASQRMSLRIVATWVSLFFALPAFSNPLETLQRSYSERVGITDAEHDHRLEKLATGYISALERQLAVTQRGGDLEEVLALKQEIEALKAPKPALPELPANAAATFKKLRETYEGSVAKSVKEHAVKRVELADRMVKALKELEVQQTKDGKIEGALATRRVFEELEADPEVAAVRRTVAVEVPAGGVLGLGAWRSLADANLNITEAGQFPIGWLSDELGPMVAPILPQLMKFAEGKPALVTVPNAAVELRSGRPFSKFRVQAFLAAEGGDLEFRISVKGELIEKFTLKERPRGRLIELDVGVTQVVELSVFDNGAPTSDWGLWIDPQVR